MKHNGSPRESYEKNNISIVSGDIEMGDSSSLLGIFSSAYKYLDVRDFKLFIFKRFCEQKTAVIQNCLQHFIFASSSVRYGVFIT